MANSDVAAFCTQVGTPKQHAYAVALARKSGTALRYVWSEVTGESVSKASKARITPATASMMIDALRA